MKRFMKASEVDGKFSIGEECAHRVFGTVESWGSAARSEKCWM